MPLAFSNYKKQKINMTPYTEVTKEEFDNMAKWHRQIGYTQDEAMGMVNLNRKYVNVHTPSCLSCSSNLQTTKNELFSFYLLHVDEWTEKFNAPAPIETITPKTNGRKK
jgi:hypothetical protein